MCRIYCSPGPKNDKKKCCSFQKKLKKIQNGQLKTSILMIWAHFGPAAEKKKKRFSATDPQKHQKRVPKRTPNLKLGGSFESPRGVWRLKSSIWPAIVKKKKQDFHFLDTKKHLFCKNGKVDFEKNVSFCQNPLHPDPSCIEGVWDFDTFGAKN